MKDEDLRIEPFSNKPKGGQHVGVTDTGVQVTHKPTGITVFVFCERSQWKNLKIAKEMIEYGLACSSFAD